MRTLTKLSAALAVSAAIVLAAPMAALATTIGTDISTANLTASGNLTVSGNSSLGTVTAGTWNGTAIGNGYLGTGIDAAKLSAGSVSNTEFDYLAGVTSAIQTQLDAKASTSSVANAANWDTAYGWGNHASAGYATLTGSETLTNKSLTSPQINQILPAGATAPTLSFYGNSTNVNYIEAGSAASGGSPGFAAKGSDTNVGLNLIPQGTGTVNVVGNLTVSGAITSGAWNGTAIGNTYIASGLDAAKLSAGSVSNTEFDYLNGVTSAIQTQLDGKMTAAGGYVTGTLYLTDNDAASNDVNLVLGDDDETGYIAFVAPGGAVTLKAPSSLSGSSYFTLPPNSGTAGYVLKTDGAGNTSWTNVLPTHSHAASDITSGTLGVTNGGTGLSTVAAGDILYASATDTLSRLAKGTDGQVLKLSSGVPVWGTDLGSTEADTLASVTSRGATTNVPSSFTGGATIRGLVVDTATATDDTIQFYVGSGGAARYNSALSAVDQTAAHSWLLPDVSGTIITSGNLTSISAVGTISSGTWHATPIAADSGGTGMNSASSTGVPYITSGTWSVDPSALLAGHGGTGQTSYTVGDILYASGTAALSPLAGNTATTKKFLAQTGTGTASAAPVWATLASSDLPAILATNLPSTPQDYGASNISVDLSNSNVGGYMTSLVIDGALRAASLQLTNTSPAITDGSGSVYLALAKSSTPVNYVLLSASDTGGPPIISAAGADTNIDLSLDSKGTGSIHLNGGSASTGCTVDASGNLTCSGTIPATEADTLATVTGRGVTTSAALSLTGGATVRGLTVDTATTSDDRLVLAPYVGGPGRYDGTISSADLTTSRTWTFPDNGGTVALLSDLSSYAASGANSDITSLSALSTPLSLSQGGTGRSTALVQGSIMFAGASGAFSEDNASLFWDDSTNHLGIGDTTPAAALTVGSGDAFQVDSSGNVAQVNNITMTGVLTHDASTLTAGIGSAQGNATAITSEVVNVNSASAPNDSVKLPAATVGRVVYVQNNSGYNINLFADGADLLNGVASTTPISIPYHNAAICIGFAGGWNCIQ